MPRLYRPHIPLETRCRVALRQLGRLDDIDRYFAVYKSWGRLLKTLLSELSIQLHSDLLHLDHDPPLATRPLMHKRKTGTIVYKPDANDPDHLIYRGKQAHKIKTNVRGDHGQHPDRVLIKKERRRREGPKKKRKTRWPKRKLVSRSTWPKRRMR